MRHMYGEGPRIANLFFTCSVEDCDVYICKCGKRRKKTGSSYANLVSHVRSAHPDYRQLLSNDDKGKQSLIQNFMNSNKAGQYFGGYDLVINRLLPFSTVENTLFRNHVRHEPLSLSTFMKHMHKLVTVVERKISQMLPQKFGLIFDEGTSSSTHYLAVFASFCSRETNKPQAKLLTISPLEDESRLDADGHIAFLTYILNLYSKSWENVLCISADNASVNKSISNKTGVPLIECASHRFNLAVNDVLVEDDEQIVKVNKLMIELRTLIISAKLRKLTPLRPKIRNETPWSSVFDMLVRYCALREYLPRLDCVEIDELCSTYSEDRKVNSLLTRLEILNSVTKTLQNDGTYISNVRALFDAVINDYPSLCHRLSCSAKIVLCPSFESAITKVQNGNISALSREERHSIAKFKISNQGVDLNEDINLSFVQKALKRQKVEHQCTDLVHIDTQFAVPTSNACERLFSKVGHLLTDRRSALTPANLEAQVFLHSNRDIWGPDDINKLLV